MSTLQMLDVAIGIIFIFLLLSLICSAGNEIIEAVLKKRSSDLHDGIHELLDGSDKGIESSLLEKLYNHPLISSLFRGKYNPKSTRNLPSYIPSKNFALALLDIIMPASSGKLSGAASGSSNAAAVREIAPTAADSSKDETPKANIPGDAPPDNTDQTAEEKNDNIVGANILQNTAKNIPANPLGGLREAVIDMPESNAKQALLTLIDAAGNDMNKVRENIEIWFNTSMDRVSGWYKRRIQWILIVLGLLTAVALNADTIAIFKSLMKDEPLRNSLIAASSEYAKENIKDSMQAPQDRVESNVRRLNDLRLPMGWDWNTEEPKKDSTHGNNHPHFQNFVNNAELAIPPGRFWPWFFKALGWLLTALAVSQGAPFWFDLLNKFMVIRSTVKPHEKSPEEASEDRQKNS